MFIDACDPALQGKDHEIRRSADRDPRPFVHWRYCLWDAQTADYRRPSSRFHRELADSVAWWRPLRRALR
jgi:hypothetical protein